MDFSVPRIMISALSSASGKTTAVCGILAALAEQNFNPCGVKCGPDYIDPLYHKAACGKRANIDLFFTNKEDIIEVFAHDVKDSKIAVIEGAMGYFDGLSIDSCSASAFDIARTLLCPVVLVVDASARALSVCAEIHGAKTFRSPDLISAVILNRCSAALYKKIAPIIEKECSVKVLGYFPKDESFSLDSRNLGLVLPFEEKSAGRISNKIESFKKTVLENIDLKSLLEIAFRAEPLHFKEKIFPAKRKNLKEKIIIAVAKDEAFSFYYRENFDLMESFGAKIEFFSPLHDSKLPENCSAIYIGGGYPELYSELLKANECIKKELFCAVLKEKMPVFAECGGFMYLKLIGILPGLCKDTGHLVRFGYCTVTAKRDTLLCEKGTKIPVHEFHHFDSAEEWENGNAFFAQKLNGKNWECIVAEDNIFAGWPHFYFPSYPKIAENFIRRAISFASKKKI